MHSPAGIRRPGAAEKQDVEDWCTDLQTSVALVTKLNARTPRDADTAVMLGLAIDSLRAKVQGGSYQRACAYASQHSTDKAGVMRQGMSRSLEGQDLLLMLEDCARQAAIAGEAKRLGEQLAQEAEAFASKCAANIGCVG